LRDEPSSGQLYTDFEERVALQYLQTMWNLGADLEIIEEMPQRVDRPIYITRRALAIDADLDFVQTKHPQAAGEQLIALWPALRQHLPPQATTLTLNFGNELTLSGYELKTTSHSTKIVFYWQTNHRLTIDYTISVRPLIHGQLITVDGENLIQDHQPVWGVYPTSKWQPGEVVRDVYALSLPVAPEQVQIVVYKVTEFGFENLDVQVINFNWQAPTP
jgi:hypothetical protein